MLRAPRCATPRCRGTAADSVEHLRIRRGSRRASRASVFGSRGSGRTPRCDEDRVAMPFRIRDAALVREHRDVGAGQMIGVGQLLLQSTRRTRGRRRYRDRSSRPNPCARHRSGSDTRRSAGRRRRHRRRYSVWRWNSPRMSWKLARRQRARAPRASAAMAARSALISAAGARRRIRGHVR